MPAPLAFAKIRKLQAADAGSIFIVLELARDASKVPIGPKWTYQQLETECREPGLVALNNDGIQSFVLWRDTGAAWEISFLATAPDAQGQGLMTALLEHLKRDRPSNRPIWLEAHVSNLGARALYGKLGFSQTGERKGYYADGGTAVLYSYGSEGPVE
jgi:ribosomal protein S18 acetylase RimI-like enzyme